MVCQKLCPNNVSGWGTLKCNLLTRPFWHFAWAHGELFYSKLRRKSFCTKVSGELFIVEKGLVVQSPNWLRGNSLEITLIYDKNI